MIEDKWKRVFRRGWVNKEVMVEFIRSRAEGIGVIKLEHGMETRVHPKVMFYYMQQSGYFETHPIDKNLVRVTDVDQFAKNLKVADAAYRLGAQREAIFK